MTVRLIDLPPSTPKVVTPLWTVTKDAQRVDAQLVDNDGPAGWELRMLQNLEWLSGRRFSDRADAVAHAEQTLQHLLSRGWAMECCGSRLGVGATS